ncbi:putative ribonuclease H-like domain-containing protein [Tanacetum coccineum]
MNQDISRRTINVEETSSKAIVAIDGASFDWSYMADDKVPTNMALMAFSDSELHFKRGLASVEEQLVFYKKNEVIFYEQLAVLKRDITYKDSELNMLKKEFQQPEFEGYGPKTSKNVSEDTSNEVRESPDAPMVEKLVSDDKLEKKTIFPTVAKIEFVRPKQQEKTVRKPVSKHTAITIKGKGWNLGIIIQGPKAVNTARPNSTVVNAVRVNQVNAIKASACWVWRPTKLNSALITLKKHNYVDAQANPSPGTCPISQTSRNLMEDMLPLGEEPKEGKLLVKELLKLGKQHKASCKSKIQNSITQPLFMLHMDLFGPTFVSSLMNKKYCLVVTDDYSRFTWVFFLATKDETSGILKSFITEIENLVDKKVKIIRCDNGTEFKNKVMSEFCEQKGIKREFSVARTPQQNGVAERRNRTLIEAARTMLADSKLPTTFWAEAVNTTCYV